jgi:hypothetical protein
MDESRSQIRFYCIGKRAIYMSRRLLQIAQASIPASEFAGLNGHQFDAATGHKGS